MSLCNWRSRKGLKRRGSFVEGYDPQGQGRRRRFHLHLPELLLGAVALGNVIPFPSAVARPDGRICRRERLGGLLNFYERKAA
jgi:hypothetical protein